MTVRVVVDSALNIPQDIAEKLGIHIVPVSVMIDGKTYREGVDASRSTLVSLIGASKQLGTSQPAPGDFLEVYEKLGGEIVSIHVTSRSSGTYQSACIAATMTTKAKVVVLDSAQVALGGGWQAIAAALKANEGATLDEVVKVAQEAKAEARTFVTVPTLKYLSRSGRVTFAKALIASLLSVKPVMSMNDGLLEVVSKSRHMSGALTEMVSLLKDKRGTKSLAVAIMHADDLPSALQLRQLVEKELSAAYVVVTDLTASLVVHGGPGTVALSVIPMEYVKALKEQ